MKKYSYSTDKYRFRELVSELYQVDKLEKVHEDKSDWVRDEYKKLNVYKISVVNDIKKLSKIDINSIDIMIVSLNILMNDNYEKYIKLYPYDDINNYKQSFTLYGGILSDEVGLGKTLSCIGYIMYDKLFNQFWFSSYT